MQSLFIRIERVGSCIGALSSGSFACASDLQFAMRTPCSFALSRSVQIHDADPRNTKKGGGKKQTEGYGSIIVWSREAMSYGGSLCCVPHAPFSSSCVLFFLASRSDSSIISCSCHSPPSSATAHNLVFILRSSGYSGRDESIRPLRPWRSMAARKHTHQASAQLSLHERYTTNNVPRRDGRRRT